MRTNVVLDDDLIGRARQLTGLKTKHAIIHVALKTLILLYEQAEDFRCDARSAVNVHTYSAIARMPVSSQKSCSS
jgi:Arc/MetJ family transcription regulator